MHEVAAAHYYCHSDAKFSLKMTPRMLNKNVDQISLKSVLQESINLGIFSRNLKAAENDSEAMVKH